MEYFVLLLPVDCGSKSRMGRPTPRPPSRLCSVLPSARKDTQSLRLPHRTEVSVVEFSVIESLFFCLSSFCVCLLAPIALENRTGRRCTPTSPAARPRRRWRTARSLPAAPTRPARFARRAFRRSSTKPCPALLAAGEMCRRLKLGVWGMWGFLVCAREGQIFALQVGKDRAGCEPPSEPRNVSSVTHGLARQNSDALSFPLVVCVRGSDALISVFLLCSARVAHYLRGRRGDLCGKTWGEEDAGRV